MMIVPFLLDLRGCNAGMNEVLKREGKLGNEID